MGCLTVPREGGLVACACGCYGLVTRDAHLCPLSVEKAPGNADD